MKKYNYLKELLLDTSQQSNYHRMSRQTALKMFSGEREKKVS